VTRLVGCDRDGCEREIPARHGERWPRVRFPAGDGHTILDFCSEECLALWALARMEGKREAAEKAAAAWAANPARPALERLNEVMNEWLAAAAPTLRRVFGPIDPEPEPAEDNGGGGPMPDLAHQPTQEAPAVGIVERPGEGAPIPCGEYETGTWLGTKCDRPARLRIGGHAYCAEHAPPGVVLSYGGPPDPLPERG
jgi:hypothetical protein